MGDFFAKKSHWMSFRDLEAGELGDPSTADYPTGIFIY